MTNIFWILIFSFSIGLFLYIRQIINGKDRFFSCKVCNGKGHLNGNDEFIGVSFKWLECFYCRGNKFIIPYKKSWYSTRNKAGRHMNTEWKEANKIQKQIDSYMAEIKVSKNLKDKNLKKRYDEQLKALKKQKEFYLTKYEHYKVIKTHAHLMIYIQYVHHKQNKWDKQIAKNSRAHTEQFSMTIADGEDAKLQNFLESDITAINDYLDSMINEEYTEELITDVKKATLELKKAFNLT